MSAFALLTDLQRQGFRLEATNDRLRVIPASRLTDELRYAIRQHKTELLRDTSLIEACREHGLDPAVIRNELIESNDWYENMTPDVMRAYVAAVARSRLPGTRAELRALISQWADAAALADDQHQELLEAAEGLAPALIGESVRWFHRRLGERR